MIIPNLYMFLPDTLEFSTIKPAPVVDGIVLDKNSFGTTTPTGHNRPGFVQVWKSNQYFDYIYPKDILLLANSGDDGAWYYIEDHRGTEYWLDTDDYTSLPKTMTVLGPLPDNSTLVPPKKPLEVIYTERMQKIDTLYMEKYLSLVDGYTPGEIASFDRQYQEAIAFSSTKKAATPYLETLAKTRNIPVKTLVAKVLEKAESYQKQSATLLGLKQSYQDKLSDIYTRSNKTDQEKIDLMDSLACDFTIPQDTTTE